MAVWTPPITWNADQLVKQDDLNAQIRDNMTILAVPIDTVTGNIRALDSSCFASLDGSNITGVAHLGGVNVYTAGKQDFNGGASTRVVLPVGSNKYAT